MALLAAVYYGAAHLGYAFEFAGPVGAIVWLPVGVAIAGLYFGGLGLWPGVVLGDLLVNNYSALPLGTALATSAGNLLEVVVATLILRRAARVAPPLETVTGLATTLAALASGTLLSATVGSLASALGGVVGWGSFGHVLRTWFLGDLCGALIVVPLALAWSRPLPWPWRRRRLAEAAALLAAVMGIGWVAFGLQNDHPLIYLAFPVLIWAALRFDQRGATLAIVLTSSFAVWGTHKLGPFLFHSVGRNVLSTQLFIFVAALSALSVAALVSEREELARRVRASRVRLVEASDAERRRLERNLHDGAQQRLVALVGELGQAEELAADSGEELRTLIGDASAQATLAIGDLRELAHGIHPVTLREFGFARAVAVAAARSGVAIDASRLPRGRMDETAEATAYYVALEGMTNARKYAGTAPVHIQASLVRGRLELEVRDEGPGGAGERPGSGLEGLRDRVEATGGTFGIWSEPGKGTRLRVSIPASRGGPALP